MAKIWLPSDNLVAKLARGWPSSPRHLPASQVQINWSNQLWRGLEVCWVAGQRVNLVDGVMPSQDGTVVTGSSQTGITADFTESDTGNIYWDKEYITTEDGAGTGDFMIVAYSNPAAENDASVIAGQKWDAGGSPYNQAILMANANSSASASSGSLAMFTYAGGGVGAAQASKIDGNWHVFFGGRSANAVWVTRDLETGSFDSVSPKDISDGNRKTLIGHGGKAAGADAFDGNQSVVLIFNRFLDSRERAQVYNALTRDISQLLLPANQTPFLVGVSAAGGSYTLTVTQGTATVTGQSVTMTYTPVGSYDLIVTEGVLTVSGQSVDMLRGLQLDVTEQALTVTGQSVDMTYAPSGSYNLGVTAGTATVTGQLVDLLYSRVLTVTEQAVTVTGQPVTMTYAQPGAYTLTVTQGTVTVTGQSVTLTYSAALDLATVYARLTEVWQILGLDPNNPMTVTPTSRVSGDISQTISGDGITSTTVTRDP